jgi:hypothetical protein
MSKSKIGALTLALALALLALGALAQAEVVRKGDLQVKFEGELTPHALPRASQAPVNVSVSAKITPVGKAELPQLRQMSIAINRNGAINTKGLPVCQLDDIQPATTADALAVCRKSLVGEGSFTADVPESGQAPFPSEGKLYAFNGIEDGRPAILAHVYGTTPVPTSFTLPFELKPSKGTFGTVLTTSLPEVTGNSSYITGLSLNLGRNFSVHGHKRSYLSAGCPAPKGFPGAVFPFARASFAFAGGQTLTSVLTRSCRAL